MDDPESGLFLNKLNLYLFTESGGYSFERFYGRIGDPKFTTFEEIISTKVTSASVHKIFPFCLDKLGEM